MRMMTLAILTLVTFAISTQAVANTAEKQCPTLAGQYHCVLSNGQYSLLEILQTPDETAEEETVSYSVDYKAIPGSPDIFEASISGKYDSFGWKTRCQDQQLVSTSNSSPVLVRLYNDKEKAFIYSENGQVALRCPRRKNSLTKL